MSIENELYEKGYAAGQQSAARKYEVTIHNQQLMIDDLHRRYQYLLENFGNYMANNIHPLNIFVKEGKLV